MWIYICNYCSTKTFTPSEEFDLFYSLIDMLQDCGRPFKDAL